MSTYIYAVTRADHPHRLDGLEPVGSEEGRSFRTVEHRGLAAVVSDASADLRARRRHLASHQGVLERLLEDGATLPMQFGLVGPNDEEVRAALEEHHDAYAERLREVDGCVEYHLRAGREESHTLREVLHGSEEARELNARTRENPVHEDMVALGELLAREVALHDERAAADLVARLSPKAERTHPTEPAAGTYLCTSFLVKRGKAAELVAAVQAEAERLGEGYSLDFFGPLPPYSFV